MSTPSVFVDAFLSELDDVARRRLAEMLAPYLEPAAPTSPLLTADEAAEYLRCDRRRVWDLVRTQAIPAQRDGRRVLIHRDDLDIYLKGARDMTDPAAETARDTRTGHRDEGAA